MYHFSEGDRSSSISPDMEVAVTGDFEAGDLVAVRMVGAAEPILQYQAIYLSTGEYV